jgi:hypothetical protein
MIPCPHGGRPIIDAFARTTPSPRNAATTDFAIHANLRDHALCEMVRWERGEVVAVCTPIVGFFQAEILGKTRFSGFCGKIDTS